MTGLSLVAILISFSLLYVAQMIFSRSVALKFVVITYLFIISSGIYFTFDTYKGWPSDEKPQKGYLVYSLVIEPSETDKGAIYYWAISEPEQMNTVQKFLSYEYGTLAPRSYHLPYSKQAASKFNEANEKIKKGFLVEINEEPSGDGNGAEGNPSDGEEGRAENTDGEQEDYIVPHLKIISPDQVLRKDKQ
jgi:hypothetical protein